MKKIILASKWKRNFFTILLFFLCIPACFGCGPSQKRMFMKGGDSIAFGRYGDYTSQEVVKKLKNSKQNLTAEDIAIVTNFIVKGSDVKEQSDAEYEEWKKAVEQAPENCRSVKGMEHVGRWTAFTATYQEWKDGSCHSNVPRC